MLRKIQPACNCNPVLRILLTIRWWFGPEIPERYVMVLHRVFWSVSIPVS